MLQQTRIDTVIPYYERFLRAFPTVESLAAAPLEQVLELWSGLGYYRRARALHETARKIVRDFGGRFPRAYEAAVSLPGIGKYTASAIWSIAYGRPHAALDGNGARVIARLLARRGNLQEPAFRRRIQLELASLLSRRKPGAFNQALMELGQTVCLPRAPLCRRCPLRRWCAAYRRGQPEWYPAPRPRRATETRYLAAAWITRDRPVDGATLREVLLVRGLDEGLLGDLWNFPAAFGQSRAAAWRRLNARRPELSLASVRWDRPLGELRHGITYRAIIVHVYPGTIAAGHRDSTCRWFTLSQLPHTAISALARKIAATVTRS